MQVNIQTQYEIRWFFTRPVTEFTLPTWTSCYYSTNVILGSISLSFQSSQSGYMLVLYGDRFQMEME